MNLIEYFGESNLEYTSYDLLSTVNHLEKLIWNLSNTLKYCDYLFKSAWPNFFDFKHLIKINKRQQFLLLIDKFILVQREIKLLSRVLCFSNNSCILGCGFSGGRNRSSILAYYCSVLAPLSNIDSDGVFTK